MFYYSRILTVYQTENKLKTKNNQRITDKIKEETNNSYRNILTKKIIMLILGYECRKILINFKK